jgi:glutathione S-transferase
MTSQLVLYGFQRSTYVSVIRLVLHAKEVAFDFHDTESEMYSAEHRSRHPFGRVPVLQHGDFWLYETTAIALYIEENFAGPKLLPEDARKRAIVHQWLSALNAYFYPNIVFALVHERLVFGELGITPDEDVIAEAIPRIAECLDVMQSTLDAQRFLADNQVTMADYFLLPAITALTFVPEGQALLHRYARVNEWLLEMGRLACVSEFRATLPPRVPIEHARRWAIEHRAHASPQQMKQSIRA